MITRALDERQTAGEMQVCLQVLIDYGCFRCGALNGRVRCLQEQKRLQRVCRTGAFVLYHQLSNKTSRSCRWCRCVNAYSQCFQLPLTLARL